LRVAAGKRFRPVTRDPLKDQFMLRTFMVGLAAASLVVTLALPVAAATLREDFATDPAARGWSIAGDASLFHWDPTNQNLAATWDSAKTNTYFYLPLHTALTRDDDFRLQFDLRLQDIAIGTNPGKDSTFQIALGLINLGQAIGPHYFRGTGTNTPNLVEWDYFPDSGFGATLSAVLISTTNAWATSFNSPAALMPDTTYHFDLNYTAATQTLQVTMTDGTTTTPLLPAVIKDPFGDVAVDSLAVSSYTDAGQDPMWAGSVLAHGTVDNLVLDLPTPPVRRHVGALTAGAWQARFTGWTGWRYTLEVSHDLKTWTAVGLAVSGTGLRQTLSDPQPASDRAFYQILAEPE
jgi:hypothetical protein